jgi:hypothetical protein
MLFVSATFLLPLLLSTLLLPIFLFYVDVLHEVPEFG